MARFFLRRLAGTIPLLLGVTFLTFALVNLVPGSPVPQLARNARLRETDRARLEQHLGLDKPWPLRYVDWLGDLARGDLGLSLSNAIPVRDRILGVLPNTLLLTTAALILALAIAVPLGVQAAARRDSWLDHSVTLGAVATIAVPAFWLPLLLIILFTLKTREWGLPALPAGGMRDLRSGGGLADRLEHLILPAVSLALVQVGGWVLYVRAAIVEALRQDYVRTAAAKGLSRRGVVYGHALRNALSPLVTLVALAVPALFGGAVFVESIFAWNGVGLLALQAFQGKDYTLIMGITLMLATVTILANLLADVLHAVLDPRARDDARG